MKKLKRGKYYLLSFFIHDQTEEKNPKNLNDFDNIIVSVCTATGKKILKKFQKENLIITDPLTGIAQFEILGSETELAVLNEQYNIEIKTFEGKIELPYIGVWGIFVKLQTESDHADL